MKALNRGQGEFNIDGMNGSLQVILTLVIAIATGWLGKKMKIPAGALVGGMIGVSVFQVWTGAAAVPDTARPILQIAGGALLGHAIGRSDLLHLRSLMKPALLLLSGLVAINIGLGYLLFKFSHLDLTTAMYAAAPGGVSDMALIIEEMNGDTATVSMMQIFRLFSIYLLYPPVFKLLAGKTERQRPLQGHAQGIDQSGSVGNAAREISAAIETPVRQWRSGGSRPPADRERAVNFLQTLLVSACGGLLFIFLKVPAGGMVGGVLFSGLYNVRTGRGWVPKPFGFLLQAGVGALIGSNVTGDSLLAVRHLIVPILIMTAALMLFTALLGYVMFKTTSLDLTTSVLAITPGGIQEMSMIAKDLGLSATPVIVMHTVRLVAVICIFPSVITMLL